MAPGPQSDAPSDEIKLLRHELVKRLWRGIDPFQDFVTDLESVDIQGWDGSAHVWFDEIIPFLRPTIIVEVGVWKGAATIHMAELLRRHGIPGVVIAVDTWLGSWEHWLNDPWFCDLRMKSGRPDMQRVFMNNVASRHLQDYVLPLPLDSLNAAQVAALAELGIGLLHLDAGHDREAVAADLRVWWPLILPGGVLIGDDFHTDGRWPGVNAAFEAFTAEHDMPYQEFAGKILLQKTA